MAWTIRINLRSLFLFGKFKADTFHVCVGLTSGRLYFGRSRQALGFFWYFRWCVECIRLLVSSSYVFVRRGCWHSKSLCYSSHTSQESELPEHC